MESILEGFAFNDFCLECQKVTEHKISSERKEFFGICSSCGQKRAMDDVNQVFYPKAKLWLTRFKIGNLPSVVTGKLIEAAKHPHTNT
jgi:hypothetical protein